MKNVTAKLILILIVFFYSCNNPNSNDTIITINTNSDANRSKEDVTAFRLTVSANDTQKIVKTFTGPKFSLSVSSGFDRFFLLEALDTDGRCIYKDSKTVNLIKDEVEIIFNMKEVFTIILDDDIESAYFAYNAGEYEQCREI